jgi:hypothetical protein
VLSICATDTNLFSASKGIFSFNFDIFMSDNLNIYRYRSYSQSLGFALWCRNPIARSSS